MSAVIETPVEFVESLGAFRFPSQTDAHLQDLMDRHSEGKLTPAEIEELEGLVELSEKLSLVRAQAIRLLNRAP